MPRVAPLFGWAIEEPEADTATGATTMRVRACALLLGAGGVLALATLALPQAAGRHVAGLAVPGVVAVVAAVAIGVGRDRCSTTLLGAMTPLSTVLCSVVMLSAGRALVPAYAALYSWVVLCSAWFQTPRAIAANLVFIAAAYAGVLLLAGDARSAQIDWLLAVTALAILALAILGLRLTQLGCTLAQGFFLARPMPALDVPAFGLTPVSRAA